MQIKEYKIFRSPAKTAKENGLILADGIGNNHKRLFDFTLLDEAKISEEEKKVIKDWALKDISASYLVSYYAKKFNNFYACEGNARYMMQRVFARDGKRLYNIFCLDFINHNMISRKSIYVDFVIDNYQHRSENLISEYIEIA